MSGRAYLLTVERMSSLATFGRTRTDGRPRTFLLALVAACLAFGAAAPAAAPVPLPSHAQNDAAARDSTRFVAFGDSLTAGYGNPGMPWPVQLASMRADLTLVRNSGVAGNTTRDMLGRIGRDVYAYSPDLLLIFAGINDLSACESVDEIVTNIGTMVAGARAHGIERVLILLNSHSIVIPAGPACVPTVQAKIDRLDEAVKDYAEAAAVQTIDLRPVLDTNGAFTDAFFLTDGIHFNSRGVDRVSAAIADQLEP